MASSPPRIYWDADALIAGTHSHQRSGEVARLAATRPGQPPRIVVEEDCIVVGGVRIPRRRVESSESA